MLLSRYKFVLYISPASALHSICSRVRPSKLSLPSAQSALQANRVVHFALPTQNKRQSSALKPLRTHETAHSPVRTIGAAWLNRCSCRRQVPFTNRQHSVILTATWTVPKKKSKGDRREVSPSFAWLEQHTCLAHYTSLPHLSPTPLSQTHELNHPYSQGLLFAVCSNPLHCPPKWIFLYM